MRTFKIIAAALSITAGVSKFTEHVAKEQVQSEQNKMLVSHLEDSLSKAKQELEQLKEKGPDTFKVVETKFFYPKIDTTIRIGRDSFRISFWKRSLKIKYRISDSIFLAKLPKLDSSGTLNFSISNTNDSVYQKTKKLVWKRDHPHADSIKVR